jgi:hypothetical protein
MADIKVRVGQQNSIKVVSSVSGSAGGFAVVSENVIGGIASVTSLNVSGISSFTGDSFFNKATFKNLNVGIVTISDSLYYQPHSVGGVAFFGNNGLLVSSGGTDFSIDYSNYILTTDNAGSPAWTSVIDGGIY